MRRNTYRSLVRASLSGCLCVIASVGASTSVHAMGLVAADDAQPPVEATPPPAETPPPAGDVPVEPPAEPAPAEPAPPAEPPPPPLPSGTVTQAPVVAGANDVGGAGTFAAVKDPTADKPLDATEVAVQAGGLWTFGNARSYLGTARGDFRLRRSAHQFEAIVLGNYGAAAQSSVDEVTGKTKWSDYDPNVSNAQARARYDLFLGKRWSVFLMGTYRYDYFQNLDARVNIDPGVAFYVINQPGHRLWFEGGLDLQFDKYRKVEVGKDESVIIVAGRAFAGYAKKFGETAELKTNVEFLQGAYSNTKSTSKQKPQRLIWDTSLAVHLVDALSVAGSFTLRWEKRVPKDESFYPLDTITALSLVYRFL